MRERGEERRREKARLGPVHTNGLRGDQVAEEGGKHDEHHGVGDPGQVLQQDVTLELSIHPLIH